jgi:phosphatidylinositol glycan class B
MLWLLVTRRFRLFGLACASGLVVAGLLGLLDRLTWGDWFHSFIAYVDFNVLSGKSAAQFGALPWWYYLQRLVLAPWAGVGFVAWRAQRAQRAWLFVAAALGYFAVVSATAHKEDRFVYPTLVLLSIAGAPAFVAWASRTRSRWSTRSLLAGCLLGGAAFYVVPSPWEPLRKEQFQLEVKASRRRHWLRADE